MNPLPPELENIPPETERDRQVDRAVREHLDAAASRINPQTILTGIRSKVAIVPAPKPMAKRRSWSRWTVIATGLIAASVAAFFLLRPGHEIIPQRNATAAELVKEAKIRHETTVEEYCYDVEADWEVTPFNRMFPFRPIIRKATIWTRKNEFFVQSKFEDQRFGDRSWAWGQEQSGKVWIAPTRKRVLIYEAEDMAEPLARFCDLMSLRLVNTLTELLDSSDMSRVDENKPGESIRIDARMRPPRFVPPGPRIVRAELELDPKTKTIRKAILHRQVQDETVGKIVFTLNHVDHRQPDINYMYKGHVDANAEVNYGPKLPPNVQRFDPKNDPRVKFREEWLRQWKVVPP